MNHTARKPYHLARPQFKSQYDMNIILFSEEELDSERRITLKDRRFEHVRAIHRAQVGDTLRMGQIGGKMGNGTLISMGPDHGVLEVDLITDPPPPLQLRLFLALPRPKFIARIFQTVASLGVKEIHLFNSYRVDKVYWSCEQLSPTEIREACLLGLEQARDTILPEVHLHRRFKPFVEDELPQLIQGHRALLAHPIAESDCPYALREKIALGVGPEGGFIPYEVDKLREVGFTSVRLTERILKVETAIITLIGRLT